MANQKDKEVRNGKVDLKKIRSSEEILEAVLEKEILAERVQMEKEREVRHYNNHITSRRRYEWALESMYEDDGNEFSWDSYYGEDY